MAFQRAWAERLPFRSYSTDQGLVGNFVVDVRQDSTGFIWVCTRSGLSRFDGTSFVSYTTAQGLPIPTINCILESRDGFYWIGTNGAGICRLDPARGRVSRAAAGLPALLHLPVDGPPASNRVNVMWEDRSGRIWAGTDAGIYRLRRAADTVAFDPLELPAAFYQSTFHGVYSFAEDPDGSLWAATDTIGFLRIPESGAIEQFSMKDGLHADHVSNLFLDRKGRLWVCTTGGLCRLEKGPGGRRTLGRITFDDPDLRTAIPRAGVEGPDGRVWLTVDDGLLEFDGDRVRSHTLPYEVRDAALGNLTVDRNGNLWVATSMAGVLKMTMNGFVSFFESGDDALSHVYMLGEGPDGAIYACDRLWNLGRVTQGGATETTRLPPADGTDSGWMRLPALMDHAGSLWVGSESGLHRYPPVHSLDQLSRTSPRIYDTPRELVGRRFYRMCEDSEGDIWIINVDTPRVLFRWNRATDSLTRFDGSRGLPEGQLIFCVARDRGDNVWLGTYDGGLYRLRGGLFDRLPASAGWPGGMITGLYLDRKRRLWITSNEQGLFLVEDPAAELPTVTRQYTVKEGLSTDDARCVVEDEFGRIYVGTSCSVDRLDPETGRIRRFTAADGLCDSFITRAYRDRRGWLWFGTLRGIARLIPTEDREPSPPPILIGGLRAGGLAYHVSEIGEAVVSGLQLGYDEAQLQVDFSTIDFGLGANPRFSYLLEGADRDWSPPSPSNSVNYARLAPGSYRLRIVAINTDGLASDRPATISFEVLSPFYRRWWFIAMTSAMLAALIYLLYRYRVERLLHVERVRTRIASDLHDDIGAGLSHVAVLSEVLCREWGRDGNKARLHLDQIARISREAVDSMSDIVWAVNPQRDRLHSLTQRMRHLANDLLPPAGIEFEFEAPGSDQDFGMGADLRREVYLICKESLNNIVRHAAAKNARLTLGVQGPSLVLEITDDGRGFIAEHESGGHGLLSMRRRATHLGAKLEVESAPDRGTIIRLTAPLHRPIW
ncbi:MAG: two-component regulator propeller domain-containing protein [Acidobacteriota bacterium]